MMVCGVCDRTAMSVTCVECDNLSIDCFSHLLKVDSGTWST